MLRTKFLVVVGLLVAQGSWAVAAKVTAEVPDPEPNRWHLGVESVFGFTKSGGKVLPGAGIAVGKTPYDSGFIFDAGLYVMVGGLTPPAYFHGGYQFSPHWRLWGYAGLSIVLDGGDVFDKNFPLLITGFEGEWRPLIGGVELSLLAGAAFAYFVIPLAPYAGTRLVVPLSDSFALQAVMRVFIAGGEAGALGSAGVQIKL